MVRHALACWLLAACTTAPDLGEATSPIVGGTIAPAGAFPELAAVVIAGTQVCTGTLIAPTVVLTAGHCIQDAIDHVRLGVSNLETAETGETLTVHAARELEAADLGVLLLDTPSTHAPRPIASGWAAAGLVNGALTVAAGYGAVDLAGHEFHPELRQVELPIVDATCATTAGCDDKLAPGGELAAGGHGKDTCFGDSGGPLYFTDARLGTFVAGVTSRSIDHTQHDCGDGGIYVRPGTFAASLEALAGQPLARGPEPAALPITAPHGAGGETVIAAHDPVTSDHDFAIARQPTHGKAAVTAEGRVRVCPEQGFDGADRVIVAITDAHDATRTIYQPIAITVPADGRDEACDVEAFSDGGGCCDAGGGSGGGAAGALGGLVALVIGRRRSSGRPRRW